MRAMKGFKKRVLTLEAVMGLGGMEVESSSGVCWTGVIGRIGAMRI
jgi:hypothetical protein